MGTLIATIKEVCMILKSLKNSLEKNGEQKKVQERTECSESKCQKQRAVKEEGKSWRDRRMVQKLKRTYSLFISVTVEPTRFARDKASHYSLKPSSSTFTHTRTPPLVCLPKHVPNHLPCMCLQGPENMWRWRSEAGSRHLDRYTIEQMPKIDKREAAVTPWDQSDGAKWLLPKRVHPSYKMLRHISSVEEEKNPLK